MYMLHILDTMGRCDMEKRDYEVFRAHVGHAGFAGGKHNVDFFC